MVRGTSFRQFVDFASPAFFEVLPARALFGEATELVGAYRDQTAFENAVRDRSDSLRDAAIPVEVRATSRGFEAWKPMRVSEDDRRRHGRTILQVYFHQIYMTSPTLIDLGLRRWGLDDDGLVWVPGGGHKAWPDDFRQSLGRMYSAFYEAGPEALRSALAELGMEATTDLFLEHFGGAEQQAVRFQTRHFTESFHRIFLRCRDEGIRLHPGFLPLGLYLATLYQTLEALAVPLDVRRAFQDARKGLPQAGG